MNVKIKILASGLAAFVAAVVIAPGVRADGPAAVPQQSKPSTDAKAGTTPTSPAKPLSDLDRALLKDLSPSDDGKIVTPTESPKESLPKPQPEKKPSDSKPATESDLPETDWPTGLEAAKRRAKLENRPLLIRAGASWCGPCRALERELAKPEVSVELRRWTLVYIDTDASPDEAELLGVTAIPALRVVNAAGRVVASKAGVAPADELVAWLRENYSKAGVTIDPVLTSKDVPDAAATVKLLAMFHSTDPIDREGAIRRLEPFPQAAADRTIGLFIQGKLGVRLASLELLARWKAPIDGLDPWQPQTINAQRIAALRRWAKALPSSTTPQTSAIDRRTLDDVRIQLSRLPHLSDEDADALIEHLAAFGPDLLPTVAAELKQATADQARQRLATLRYRLVASDALALTWSGGLSRLASTEPAVRRRAAEELIKRATADDQALLVELFSDPDPLIREISLRGLLMVGGPAANAELVRLLDDPEPNVRAAVLKQLAEHPSPEMVAPVAKYVDRERDPDLLVHAIRFLKNASSGAATDCLMKLLQHNVWQVRAEAAEALSEIAKKNSQSSQAADIYAALIHLLDDPDSFVASRAIEGLSRADLAAAADPLIRVATTRPELAKAAVEALVEGNNTRGRAIPTLRKLASAKDAGVRAVAVNGLVVAAPDACDVEVLAALKDSDRSVRTAAAASLKQLYDSAWPNGANGNVATPQLGEGESPPPKSLIGDLLDFLAPPQNPKSPQQPQSQPTDPTEIWMLHYRSGKGRPQWMTKLVGPLSTMLKSPAADERLAAAIAIVPLGQDDTAIPVLRKIVADQPNRFSSADSVLCWLPWNKRIELFNYLMSHAAQESDREDAITEFGKIKSDQARSTFWNLLAPADNRPVSDELRQSVYRILIDFYDSAQGEVNPFGNDPSDSSTPPGQSKDKLAELISKGREGTRAQRIVAMAILTGTVPAEVAKLAQPILDDPKSPAGDRQAAFRMLLLSVPQVEAEKIAIARINAPDKQLRTLALMYLAQGYSSMQTVRNSAFEIWRLQVFQQADARTPGTPIEVSAPAELRADTVKPMLHDPDPEMAASGGYLLATLGDAQGLDPLLKYWRSGPNDEQTWTRLVYRAIAAINDSQQLPVLIDIYQHHRSGLDMSDFYWTIRNMTGPEILKFRKQIRDEVGMDNLR